LRKIQIYGEIETRSTETIMRNLSQIRKQPNAIGNHADAMLLLSIDPAGARA
jgi:hypothetical protein